MAKTAACIVGCNANSGLVDVSVSVSIEGQETNFTTSFSVNFANSSNQLVSAIKSRIATLVTEGGNPTVQNDVILFGGPV